MPHYFTCPTCKRQNHGFKHFPKGDESYPESCLLCGQTKITWVADQGMAKLYEADAKEHHESAHLFAIGSGQSDITYTEPGLNSAKAQEWGTLLVPHATLNAHFSQGNREEKMSSQIRELETLGEGQCLGQCLHWVRRVLQGGQETYVVAQKKDGRTRSDSEIWARQKGQTKGGADVQLSVEKETKSNSIYIKKVDDFDNKLALKVKTVGIELVKSPVSPGRASYKYKRLPSCTLSDDDYDSLVDKAGALRNQIAAMDFFEYGWDEFAKVLDRGLQSKKRKFSGVVATQSVHKKAYDGNKPYVTFFKTLCDDPEFRVGSAVLISASLATGNTAGNAGGAIGGHGIAAHYKGDNAIYLFDPNAGVFVCKHKADLQQALVLLFEKGWMGKLGWQMKNDFGYTLFEHRDTQPQQGSGETAIVTTSSPTTTAYENKAVLPATVSSKPAEIQSISSPRSAHPQSSTQSTTTTTTTTGFRPQSTPKQLVKTTTQVTLPATGSGDLTKSALQAVLDDASRRTATFFGQRGEFAKLDPQLAAAIRAKAPEVCKRSNKQWPDNAVLEQPAGQFKHAISVSHLKQLIEML